MTSHERPTALVVNDEPSQLRLICAVLQRADIRTRPCGSVEEALASLHSDPAIQNPVANMVGASGRLAEAGDLNETQRDLVSRMEANANSVLALVASYLRADAGRAPLTALLEAATGSSYSSLEGADGAAPSTTT